VSSDLVDLLRLHLPARGQHGFLLFVERVDERAPDRLRVVADVERGPPGRVVERRQRTLERGDQRAHGGHVLARLRDDLAGIGQRTDPVFEDPPEHAHGRVLPVARRAVRHERGAAEAEHHARMIACVGEESRLPGRDPAQAPEGERDALDQRLLHWADRLELGSHRREVPLPGFPFVRQNACRDAVSQGTERSLVLRFLAHSTPLAVTLPQFTGTPRAYGSRVLTPQPRGVPAASARSGA
jgi:hypothetical protein